MTYKLFVKVRDNRDSRDGQGGHEEAVTSLRDVNFGLNLVQGLNYSDVLISVITHLQKAFIDTYKKCDKGKGKYLRFQLEWYKLDQDG